MQDYFKTVEYPYFAAEFDYFRVARDRWEFSLIRLIQMGLAAVSISVPWGFHEFKEGTIDLTGATAPRRNLVELIELCAVFKLHCWLKLGLYSDNKGLLNDGLPLWLAKEGEGLEQILPEMVERWHKVLSQQLKQYQWPEGPIVLLQLDDRPGQKQPIYNKQLTEVKWPIWLRKRYHGLEALNAAYGAAYHSVSEVEFPQTWSQEMTALEKDPKRFLEETQHDTQQDYRQTLLEAGWHIPIHTPTTNETVDDLPAIHDYLVTGGIQAIPAELKQGILVLQQPLQVEPDPVDVGKGPVWAKAAPIRADGSLRPGFWRLRHQLWQQALPGSQIEAEGLKLVAETEGFVSCGQDMIFKTAIAKRSKAVVYRLYFSGELQVEQQLKATRGQLSGPYLQEDQSGQTDLILFLEAATKPLGGFILTYLRTLLSGQAHTLAHCARLVTTLSESLAPAQPEAEPATPGRSGPTSYTLAEARRGLREADEILRRAVTSIGGLEAGFGTMLGRSKPEMPQPAPAAVTIRPDIFEGTAQEVLLAAGHTCRLIAPELNAAAEALRALIDGREGLTVEVYRQGYSTATATAETCREKLLAVIAQLRSQIAAETLPLVAWRVHDQVQDIAERLRWGVLRDR
jgi:hypothetical protein